MPDSITSSPPTCTRCGGPTKWIESNISKDYMRVIHFFECLRCRQRTIISEPLTKDDESTSPSQSRYFSYRATNWI